MYNTEVTLVSMIQQIPIFFRQAEQLSCTKQLTSVCLCKSLPLITKLNLGKATLLLISVFWPLLYQLMSV